MEFAEAVRRLHLAEKDDAEVDPSDLLGVAVSSLYVEAARSTRDTLFRERELHKQLLESAREE